MIYSSKKQIRERDRELLAGALLKASPDARDVICGPTTTVRQYVDKVLPELIEASNFTKADLQYRSYISKGDVWVSVNRYYAPANGAPKDTLDDRYPGIMEEAIKLSKNHATSLVRILEHNQDSLFLTSPTTPDYLCLIHTI